MNKNIEVEGGELALRNTFGDFAIIPKDKREDIIRLINEGDHSGIDKIVSGLPKLSDYAEKGTVVPVKDGDPPNNNVDNIPLLDTLAFDENKGSKPSSILEVKKRNPAIKDDNIRYFAGDRRMNVIFDDVSQAKAHYEKRNENIETGDVINGYRCAGSAQDACLFNWRQKNDEMNPPDWLLGDASPGSVDSWEIHKFSRDSGVGTKFWDKADGEKLDLSNIPLNSLIGTGSAKAGKYISKENSEDQARHTLAVVGFTKEGEPIVYSLGSYSVLNEDNKYYDQIRNITAPSDWTNTFTDVQEKQLINKTVKERFDAEPLDIDIERYVNRVSTKAEVADGLLGGFETDLKEFNQAILDNRDLIMKDTNLTGEGFNRLHKAALALAVAESRNSSNTQKALDYVAGSSLGLTQIQNKNLDMLDEKYGATTSQFRFVTNSKSKKTRKRIGGRASGSRNDVNAVYTMLLLANNVNLMNANYSKGNSYGHITETTRGTNKILSKLTGKLEEKGVMPDVIKEMYKTTYPTEGNNKNLSDIEKMAYQWNAPARLVTGDAQGASENSYVKNIVDFYELVE